MISIVVRARLRRMLLLVGLVLAGLPVGSALADTTIGRLGGSFSVFPPGGAAADLSYVVPSGGGKITSFSYQSGSQNPGEQLDFLVLRPTAELGAYTVIGKTGVVTLKGTQTGTTVETFAANIAVQGGDVLGLWTPGPLHDVVQLGGVGGTVVFNESAQPDPNVGDVLSLLTGVGTSDLNESANFAPPLPTRLDQCMNGGWMSFGSTFKNPGDCLSFVATHGKNPPTG